MTVSIGDATSPPGGTDNFAGVAVKQDSSRARSGAVVPSVASGDDPNPEAPPSDPHYRAERMRASYLQTVRLSGDTQTAARRWADETAHGRRFACPLRSSSERAPVAASKARKTVLVDTCRRRDSAAPPPGRPQPGALRARHRRRRHVCTRVIEFDAGGDNRANRGGSRLGAAVAHGHRRASAVRLPSVP
ncbi:hypothetical protein ABVK25_012566 [Lepraria finkii]|uniref:Uncharacterized protein n=1 Tax=Lepraria finkii TaxID=1340010 RepID=A0ABR4ABX1_9LECA